MSSVRNPPIRRSRCQYLWVSDYVLIMSVTAPMRRHHSRIVAVAKAAVLWSMPTLTQSFRMFTALLFCQGACTQAQIIRTFGVSKNSVLRSVAKYREEGISGFYGPRRGRGPSVMTAEVIVQAEKLLAAGHSRKEVAKELDVQCDTLRKAIKQGRVQEPTAVAPGEFGKLIGLDRIPEVRCLRYKVSQLSQDEAPQLWAGTLSQEWMEQNSELAGILYVDGHVRLYHGRLTKLPKRYVTRQRLCLRGTTDYWVNDALGQPFFSIERPIDQGMLEALQNEIVPRLLSITYHKYPKEAWPESWFTETEVTMPNGEVVSMKLAEMGSWIGSRSVGNREMGARERRFTGRDRAVGARVDRLEITDAVHAQTPPLG